MGLECHIYGPSGHGFDLGIHKWVLKGIFMGQVGMGLIREHIYGSCMAYFWAEWGWPDGFDLGTHIWVLLGIFMR